MLVVSSQKTVYTKQEGKINNITVFGFYFEFFLPRCKRTFVCMIFVSSIHDILLAEKNGIRAPLPASNETDLDNTETEGST